MFVICTYCIFTLYGRSVEWCSWLWKEGVIALYLHPVYIHNFFSLYQSRRMLYVQVCPHIARIDLGQGFSINFLQEPNCFNQNAEGPNTQNRPAFNLRIRRLLLYWEIQQKAVIRCGLTKNIRWFCVRYLVLNFLSLVTKNSF